MRVLSEEVCNIKENEDTPNQLLSEPDRNRKAKLTEVNIEKLIVLKGKSLTFKNKTVSLIIYTRPVSSSDLSL